MLERSGYIDGRDPIIAWKNQLDKAVKAYVGNGDLKDPLVSPAYADYFKGIS